ncbi:Chaperone protein DnaK [Trichinella pseudospiralis]
MLFLERNFITTLNIGIEYASGSYWEIVEKNCRSRVIRDAVVERLFASEENKNANNRRHNVDNRQADHKPNPTVLI